MQDTINIILKLLEKAENKLSLSDLTDFTGVILEELTDIQERTQEKISNEMETLADSFGGSDFTLRQMKGE